MRAKHDTQIPALFAKQIEIKNLFLDDDDWVVERNLISNSPTSYFAVPNMILNAVKPEVPVINPMDSPKFIQRGDIIRLLSRAHQYFDKELDPVVEGEMQKTVSLIRSLTNMNKPEKRDEKEEDYGPKTASMPDPTIYPSLQIRDLLDVGELPEHL